MSGVDPNARTKDGETALTVAAYWGHVSVVEALVKLESCDVFIQNAAGKRACVIAREQGHEQVAQILHRVEAEARARVQRRANSLHRLGGLLYERTARACRSALRQWGRGAWEWSSSAQRQALSDTLATGYQHSWFQQIRVSAMRRLDSVLFRWQMLCLGRVFGALVYRRADAAASAQQARRVLAWYLELSVRVSLCSLRESITVWDLRMQSAMSQCSRAAKVADRAWNNYWQRQRLSAWGQWKDECRVSVLAAADASWAIKTIVMMLQAGKSNRLWKVLRHWASSARCATEILDRSLMIRQDISRTLFVRTTSHMCHRTPLTDMCRCIAAWAANKKMCIFEAAVKAVHLDGLQRVRRSRQVQAIRVLQLTVNSSAHQAVHSVILWWISAAHRAAADAKLEVVMAECLELRSASHSGALAHLKLRMRARLHGEVKLCVQRWQQQVALWNEMRLAVLQMMVKKHSSCARASAQSTLGQLVARWQDAMALHNEYKHRAMLSLQRSNHRMLELETKSHQLQSRSTIIGAGLSSVYATHARAYRTAQEQLQTNQQQLHTKLQKCMDELTDAAATAERQQLHNTELTQACEAYQSEIEKLKRHAMYTQSLEDQVARPPSPTRQLHAPSSNCVEDQVNMTLAAAHLNPLKKNRSKSPDRKANKQSDQAKPNDSNKIGQSMGQSSKDSTQSSKDSTRQSLNAMLELAKAL